MATQSVLRSGRNGTLTYICFVDVEFTTDAAAPAEVAAKMMARAAVLSVVLDFMSVAFEIEPRSTKF